MKYMQQTERAARAVEVLSQHYEATCSLETQKDYELLFSTRLAAQCTDVRVNTVAKVLYKRYPTLRDFAAADYDELSEIIRPCGLYQTKARDIIASARMLISDYGGRVPDSMEELLKLPGIGRKTANLVLSDYYGQPAVVTDTHCIRISNRLGLVDSSDPYKVELQLQKLIEPAEQAPFCHRLVHFGRDICTARSPKCERCPLTDICVYYDSPVQASTGMLSL